MTQSKAAPNVLKSCIAFQHIQCSRLFFRFPLLSRIRERAFFTTTHALKQMPSMFTSASSYCLG